MSGDCGYQVLASVAVSVSVRPRAGDARLKGWRLIPPGSHNSNTLTFIVEVRAGFLAEAFVGEKLMEVHQRIEVTLRASNPNRGAQGDFRGAQALRPATRVCPIVFVRCVRPATYFEV
jgi:hypothetical protein